LSTPQAATAGSNISQAVRVSAATYRALKALAAESGQPIVRYLDELVQDAYRQRLWARYAEANRELQADPKALAAQQAEEALWSVADADVLDRDVGIEWDESLEDAATW
jgi:hypothetical protein